MTTATGDLLLGEHSDASLSERLLTPKPLSPKLIGRLMLLSGAGTLMLGGFILYTVLTGIGTWGNRIPIAWGFAIINFVWWIGIGHAGTFISAILLLLRQRWRTSINRLAEAMTLFALVQAAMFPLLHLGRPWFFYWLVPYPSTMGVWPQFMSALTWDAGAIFTYTTVSLVFWYVGAIPDLAAWRDRAPSTRKRAVRGVFALGWRGTAREWRHMESLQLMLAGLATPLVVSVHSIVSMDFATSQLPGWHSPVFPPYFVAGAIFSGFAMVVTLLIPLRKLYGLDDLITRRHLSLIGLMLLITSLVVSYSYLVEFFASWYSANPFERRMYLKTRPFGPYGGLYWLMLLCNVAIPQLLWSRRIRTQPWLLFAISIAVNIGMWLERFVLIVTSQHRDFLPSSWDIYRPSLVDAAIFFGTLSFFSLLFLMLVRFFPFVPVSEIKELNYERSRSR